MDGVLRMRLCVDTTDEEQGGVEEHTPPRRRHGLSLRTKEAGGIHHEVGCITPARLHQRAHQRLLSAGIDVGKPRTDIGPRSANCFQRATEQMSATHSPRRSVRMQKHLFEHSAPTPIARRVAHV